MFMELITPLKVFKYVVYNLKVFTEQHLCLSYEKNAFNQVVNL